MAALRSLLAGLRRLVGRRTAERDLDDELRGYLASATEEYRRQGLTPQEADRRARAEFGHLDAMKDEVRQGGWEASVNLTVRDAAHALRALVRTPVFASVVILTLALGIGAATAIFSVVAPVLVDSLPYPRPDRLLLISDVGSQGGRLAVTFGTYREVLDRSHVTEVLAVADLWQPALTDVDEPERLEGQHVTAAYFAALGILPSLGRTFTEADTSPGAPKVAILSEGLARRRFGGTQRVLGEHIRLNGDPYLVVGVMPRGFENILLAAGDVWAPLKYQFPAPTGGPEWGHHLQMIARVRAGATVDDLRRELARIARTPVAAYPRPSWADQSNGFMVDPLGDAMASDVRPTLVAIGGAVALVLLIVCVNVTNLLLARGAQRRGEFALRAALGAGRARLVRHMLTESLLLALIGGGLGLLVAAGGIRALVALAPPGLPRLNAIRIDGIVFAFAFMVTTVVGVFVGAAPAWDLIRAGSPLGVHQTSRRTTAGPARLRRLLVVSEVALALILLVGTGLIWRSVERLLSRAPGFDPAHVVTLQVQEAGHRYDADPARLQFYTDALSAVRAVPGVASAAFTSQLPLSGESESYGVLFQSIPNDASDQDGSALRYAVTPDYFATMHIPLRRGRLLGAEDRPGTEKAVLLSETYARRKFSGLDPIGQRVRIGPEIGRTDGPWDVIVGVVGDVKQSSLALGAPDAFYVAAGQWAWVDPVASLVVRTTLDDEVLVPALKRAIWSVDPNQPIVRMATMDGLVAASEADRRFALLVFEIFAWVALALAVLGIYGVLSGSVTERWQEIGVRSALGASRARILGLILRQGLAMTGLGLLVGLALSVVASRGIASLLFDISRLDPLTHLGVGLVLLAAATAASAVPAWRAARVNPARALRAD